MHSDITRAIIGKSPQTKNRRRRNLRSSLPWALLAIAIGVTAAWAQPAQRNDRKPTVVGAIQTDLRSKERVSIFVELTPQLDAARRPSIRAFAAQRGATIAHEYAILPHVINIRDIARADADRLRMLPGVRSVTDDFPVSISLNDAVAQIRGTQSQITQAGYAATGAGVRVCVVDTGIDSNSVMYATRIDVAAGHDFFNNDTNPEDDNGHGSHVAGVLLGGPDAAADIGCGTSDSFAGVAPEATLIGVKALNFNGAGLASHLIAAINHCASPTLPGGPAHVINISAGGGQFTGTCDTNIVTQAANNAVAAGLVVVAAAGNSNLANSLSAPACGSQVISVGATYDRAYPNCQFPAQNFFSFCVTPTSGGGCLQTCVDNFPAADQRCCFSNRSAILDVTAPGCSIFSDDFTSPDGTGLKGFCGTSQATPHVAGLATLLHGFNPYLTPLEIRTIIRAGAIDLGAAGYDSSFGHGRIDVLNSLLLAAPECVQDIDCADGLFCNGNEICQEGKCSAGLPPLCEDGIACTIDLCDQAADTCRAMPDDTLCANGHFCDGNESCTVDGGCVPGTPPCLPTETCDDFADICRPLPGAIWMSFAKSTDVPGLGRVENEDVVAFDLLNASWSWVFDGSDVGLGSFAIDALARTPGGELLLSFRNPNIRIPGIIGAPGGGDRIDDSDIIRFQPTTLGNDTTGSFHFFFDGSDVGLADNEHNIDALALTPAGNLLLSTEGAFASGKHVWTSGDVFLFIPNELAAFTSGVYAPWFDGLSAGLGDDPGENVDGACLLPDGKMLLSTEGPFTVATASGTNLDVLELTPSPSRPAPAVDLQLMLQFGTLGLTGSAEIAALEYVP